ncbi:MAG TPA: FAD-binding protein [Amycolatopsis sp.]|nr:FAD-binding protein [Amycolatopsis sp.]
MDGLVADVVIVGFGAAGACAAIEAADAGADVLILDRFGGGGASAVSGGVVYAGGGTQQQLDAGIDDSVDAMHDYLRLEAEDIVSEATLRRFCESSREMITWLEAQGVPFEGSLCPYKTSYPGDDHYLYYSGSEAAGAFREAAKPAPRGHRVKGPGTSGKLLMSRLAEAVRRRGIRVLTQTHARNLILGEQGAVTGIVVDTLRDAPAWARARHRRLAQYAAKPGIYVPALRKSLHQRACRIEKRYARELTISARRGVILAAGGFIANREMVREHAPLYRGGLALGTSADDGSGIRLGVEAGATTAELGRISAWRFVSPPSAFIGGIIVDSAGQRVIDESRYGAAVGERLIQAHGAKGWLLVDEPIVAEARREGRRQGQWFQRLQLRYLLGRGRVTGGTLDEVARRAGVDPDGLKASAAAYRENDPMGKPAEFARPLDTPPYSLIDISIKPSLGFPCPMLTLGGLVVDEDTGAVRNGSGAPISGLYAAGRTAVGICSRSYVSGLSLADCVFSGRRAGINSALAQGVLDKNENVF